MTHKRGAPFWGAASIFRSDGKWVTGCAFDDREQPTFKGRRKLMTKSVYHRREFIALARLALSAPNICLALAEITEEVQRLIYDTQGKPLPPAALERFHRCDSLWNMGNPSG